jgi:hypothetical protein
VTWQAPAASKADRQSLAKRLNAARKNVLATAKSVLSQAHPPEGEEEGVEAHVLILVSAFDLLADASAHN